MQVPDQVLRLMRASGQQHWLTVLGPEEVTDFDALAETVGLEPLGQRWRLVDRVRAEAILTRVLHRSLAYEVELMPRSTAAWLASEFLGAVGLHGTRFATNTPDLPGTSPFGWEPATEWPIDTGVMAIGVNGAVLHWVADED